MIQLVVTYDDHQIMYFPVRDSWKIDNPTRCIVIDRGIPRTYIPLDRVRSFDVEKLPE
jgi:hypothetical protein